MFAPSGVSTCYFSTSLYEGKHLLQNFSPTPAKPDKHNAAPRQAWDKRRLNLSKYGESDQFEPHDPVAFW